MTAGLSLDNIASLMMGLVWDIEEGLVPSESPALQLAPVPT